MIPAAPHFARRPTRAKCYSRITVPTQFARDAESVRAREDEWARLYATGLYSLPDVARMTNTPSHVTVMYGIKRRAARCGE